MPHTKDHIRPKKGEQGKPPKKSTGDYKAAPAKKKPPATKVGNVIQAGEEIQHRQAYNKYRTEVVPEGGPVMSYEEWKLKNGIQPPTGSR